MIAGRFSGANPTLVAGVSFPDVEAAVPTRVQFTLDTGANFSIIHPSDLSRLLGSTFPDEEPTSSRIQRLADLVHTQFARFNQSAGLGIGGRASYVELSVRLELEDNRVGTFAFVVPVSVALPTAGNWPFPSLPGMDFLTYFDVHLNHPRNVVELEFIR